MIEKIDIKKRIFRYQQESFFSSPKNHMKNEKDAINFINTRGFVFFWPIKNIRFPSLWTATVGERPVPNNHDDPGHITWRWKDNLLDKKVWYYSKLLKRKSTIVSLELAPFFYSLTPNFGDYQNDYLLQYNKGLMSVEAKNVYEALLKYGPSNTLDLRQNAHLIATENKYRFDKALVDLQTEMKIMPIGIASAGRWNYAMIYDIVARYDPVIEEKARFLTQTVSMERILNAYFLSIGAATVNDIKRLFGWNLIDIKKICNILVEKEVISLISKQGENPFSFIINKINK